MANCSHNSDFFSRDEDGGLSEAAAAAASEVLPQYVEQYFFKALEWCQGQNEFVLETSLVSYFSQF